MCPCCDSKNVVIVLHDVFTKELKRVDVCKCVDCEEHFIRQ